MIYTIGINNKEYKEVDIDFLYKYFEKKDEIQVDTETTGLFDFKSRINCLQIGDTENQFIIDVRNVNILDFKELLESKLCILHNSKFDYKMLKLEGIVLERIYDVMLAESVLTTGYKNISLSLKDTLNRYLSIPMEKETRNKFTTIGNLPFTAEMIKYAATDVMYLQRLKELQWIKIVKEELEYCVNLENNAVKALADIEFNGVYLDENLWRENVKKSIEIERKLINSLDKILSTDELLAPKYKPKYIQGNLFGFEERTINVNYSSSQQVGEILKTLKYDLPDTSEDTLSKITNKHPFIVQLLELRKIQKIISTYGESFLENINPITKRIHTDFWQIKSTGRVSSNAPNMQNIPAKNIFRNSFRAREGFKWCSLDYSSQELRLMADGAKEQAFIDVLNKGEDLHSFVGSLMFGKTITKEMPERNEAKSINFGKPYGMGPNKLAAELQISLEKANELFKTYARLFPNLDKWLTKQGNFAKVNGYAKTFPPCKRRRYFPDILEAKALRKKALSGQKHLWKQILTIEGNTEREGMNTPIQGTGADIMKEALIVTREIVNEYNKQHPSPIAYLVLTVHDEIDLEIKEEYVEEITSKILEKMKEVGNKYVTLVNMEAELTVDDMWKK